jgi:hypothetical protein
MLICNEVHIDEGASSPVSPVSCAGYGKGRQVGRQAGRSQVYKDQLALCMNQVVFSTKKKHPVLQ